MSITGGAGFIGSNLVQYWIDRTNDTVINVDKLTYAGNFDAPLTQGGVLCRIGCGNWRGCGARPRCQFARPPIASATYRP